MLSKELFKNGMLSDNFNELLSTEGQKFITEEFVL